MDFGKGPAKWLFTRDDEKAWKQVKTPEQAQAFIDLFWVRRDPTPGTPENEFRDEILGRILWTDQHYKEGKVRGSMTERGRVFIALGKPTSLQQESTKSTRTHGDTNIGDPTGGRMQAARDVWTWSRADAIAKFNLPKVEIVFLFDKLGGGARLDPQRGDFRAALPTAQQRAIVNPELTSVPDWARPRVQTVVVPGPVLRVVREGETLPPTVTTTTTTVPRPRPVALPAGVGKLTLVRDAFAVEAQKKSDPFASLESVSSFRRSDELGFVAEYCSGVISEDLPAIMTQVVISGEIDGQRIRMNGAAEELVPDSIKASPGCHMVRGAVPLADFAAGTYVLTLKVGSHNLTKEFRIE